MNLNGLDWGIVLAVLIFLFLSVFASRKFMRSVADYLSAGRTAGRYIISISQGIAALGAITVVANFEMNFQAGFAMSWWNFSMGVVVLLITVSGWVAYRFRETRAMTMAQFFEMRYSKNFRLFAGMLGYLAGIVNFGIFPAVEAHFFMYFCGLPQTFSILGLEFSTFAVTMLFLLGISLYFVYTGGQVAVIITDFWQGLFVNFVFLILILLFIRTFSFDQILTALQTAPADASKINPFHTSQAKDFNFWFFLIGVFGAVYSTLSWQGTQGFNSSAKSAHEAKMAGVLSNWRGIPQSMVLLFIPICAYTVMRHPDFSQQATNVTATLTQVKDRVLESQLTAPLVMTQFLRKGLMGAFTAVMLMASISTLESYMHSWGSILVQDVIVPIRKKSFSPKQHINILRLAIAGVAIFAFLFSLLFKQTQYILLFFAITGAIYAGGSGAVIIGGLYWKYGTAAAAWAAMLTGSIISVGGIIIHQISPNFPINGQVFWGIAMASSVLIYIAVSWLGKRNAFDMNKLLHRGQYQIQDEHRVVAQAPVRGLKMLGMGKEFTTGDKIIYIVTYIWTFVWFFVFVIGTIYNLTHEASDLGWMKFWYIYLIINILFAALIVIWFTFGGVKNLREMFADLKTRVRDHSDDGRVVRPE
ncbi:sodium:solute symporter [candidate division KSB1 bacterium]|nr:sodium:solute symporter [candidate division KSB1 bacterium]